MKAVLTGDEEYAFLDAKAKAALTEWRNDLGALLRRTPNAFQFDGSTVTWWTFAGGRINQTLKYALEWKGGWKAVPDNFAIKIQGDSASIDRVLELLEELREPRFWQSSETRAKLRSLVPEYRLSKFQQCLPEPWQTEMIGQYLLDFEGTAGWLGGAVSARRPRWTTARSRAGCVRAMGARAAGLPSRRVAGSGFLSGAVGRQ